MGNEFIDLDGLVGLVDHLGPGRSLLVQGQQQESAGAPVQARHHVGLDVQVQGDPLDRAQLTGCSGVRGQALGLVHHQPAVVPVDDHQPVNPSSRAMNSFSRALPRSRP